MKLRISETPLRCTTPLLLCWTAKLLVLAGCGMLAWCGLVGLQACCYQDWASRSLATAGESHGSNQVVQAAPGALIGWVNIPRIGVTSAVLEGTDGSALRLGVGHIEETAMPGSFGNVALAGHRDTFFRKLKNIRRRDEILITTTKGVYKYVVDSTRVVEPEGTEVLNDLGRPTLTLVTCYPFDFVGPAPKRFIVLANRRDG